MLIADLGFPALRWSGFNLEHKSAYYVALGMAYVDISPLPNSIRHYWCDIICVSNIADVVPKICSLFGRPSILINNAGIFKMPQNNPSSDVPYVRSQHAVPLSLCRSSCPIWPGQIMVWLSLLLRWLDTLSSLVWWITRHPRLSRCSYYILRGTCCWDVYALSCV